jgi:hypothetical protein
MVKTPFKRIYRELGDGDELGGNRTDLVRLPVGANSSLFSGWGVRI